MRQIDHRVQDGRRRHQRDRNGGCTVAQGGQQEHHQNQERDHDAEQCPQTAPSGDGDDDDGERCGEHDQRPAALVVIERVGRDARLVDLAADSDVVAGGEGGLPRSAAELQHRHGVGVGPGVDGHQCVHAIAAPSVAPGVGVPGQYRADRRGRHTPPRRWRAHVRLRSSPHRPRRSETAAGCRPSPDSATAGLHRPQPPCRWPPARRRRSWRPMAPAEKDRAGCASAGGSASPRRG